jgi:pimeloyl-ACP methyl ester carboxylesterase
MQADYHCLTRSGLDLDISVFLAEAAKAAYGDLAVVNSWAGPAGFGPGNYFDCQNVQGYSCGNEEVALLAFRGTSNIGQWLRDAQFIPARHFWGTVHQGFLDGINSLETDLQAFDQLAKNAKQVWVTGHSLGGALAVLAAARLKSKGITSSLYTYGQPRVGFGDFADRFAVELPGRLIRFVNQSDIVPRVPPGFLYRHTGIVKRIVHPGVLETVPRLEMPMALDPVAEARSQVAQHAATLPAMESAAAVKASGATEPVVVETELSPLTETEFAEVRLALSVSAEGPMSEGIADNIPWIADHALTEYIRLLDEIRAELAK